ncbi:hypothetical protein IPL68_02305 [Candidatus Saccharibacteria bacterium]|nr:MAG: hypothetical protein IPL68_02305 [Candidatus Saccharibacteria bacterium]
MAHQLRDGETFAEDLFFKPMGTTENRTTKLTELAGPGLRIAGRVITADELSQARTMVEAQVKQKIGQFTEAGKTMRNKTLVTPFTNPNMPKDVELFIHQTFVAIGLEDLQKLLPVVTESQERRQSFWRAALEDISGRYKPFVEATLFGVKSPAP